MNRSLRTLLATTVALLAASSPPVLAQAFTPPQGVGSATVAWQFVDNTGHRFTDGYFLARGQSQTTSVFAEVEYGVTDRLAVTFGVPYVFAKYTGAQPPPSGLAVDQCACWHSSFQDLAFSARYSFGTSSWAVTPLARVDFPSHDYQYRGEAVVGRNLNEVQLGASAGLRLRGALRKVNVQTTYMYSFVERALDDISMNRSNVWLDGGYAVTSKLYVRGTGVWQRTHGGLRAGSPTGNPFPLPGELNTPDRRQQRDRLIRTNYWQAGAGLSYTVGSVDLFASVTKYVWGRDAHNGQSYNVGATYYFDLWEPTISLARAMRGVGLGSALARRPTSRP